MTVVAVSSAPTATQSVTSLHDTSFSAPPSGPRPGEAAAVHMPLASVAIQGACSVEVALAYVLPTATHDSGSAHATPRRHPPTASRGRGGGGRHRPPAPGEQSRSGGRCDEELYPTATHPTGLGHAHPEEERGGATRRQGQHRRVPGRARHALHQRLGSRAGTLLVAHGHATCRRRAGHRVEEAAHGSVPVDLSDGPPVGDRRRSRRTACGRDRGHQDQQRRARGPASRPEVADPGGARHGP